MLYEFSKPHYSIYWKNWSTVTKAITCIIFPISSRLYCACAAFPIFCFPPKQRDLNSCYFTANFRLCFCFGHEVATETHDDLNWQSHYHISYWWPTTPVSGATLFEATVDKNLALNAKIHQIKVSLVFDWQTPYWACMSSLPAQHINQIEYFVLKTRTIFKACCGSHSSDVEPHAGREQRCGHPYISRFLQLGDQELATARNAWRNS
jgi:hypothetical protein